MKNFALLLALAAALSAQKLTVEPLTNPAGTGALQPNWSVTPGGGAVLSWIEPLKDGSYTLKYAVYSGSAWSPARTIASGRKFFRHPAEVPEVIAMSDKQWLAHWVENPNPKSEAEFVYVSSSTDGVTWTTPLLAHKDKSDVEHGLASMAVSGNGEASVLWLETPKGEDGPGYLMRTVVDASGKEIKEERLDDDVCECCPTAVTRTSKGLLVAYRSHTPDDIRDIAVVRFENGAWTKRKVVYADNWKLNACPINAASVTAKGNRVALAWFTGAGDAAKVELVFSEDGGATFGKPTVVSTARAFGYTSVVLEDSGAATVSWLQQSVGGDAQVMARQISAAGAPGPAVQVATGGRQALGYPKLVHSQAGTIIAWGAAKPQTARLR